MFSKYPQHMASHKNAASAKLKGPRNASARVQHAAKNMYRAKPLAATRVVAAAVSVAAVGVFGAVAFELAQSNLSFDPSGYIAAYSHADAESGEAYRISPLSTDAEANRHDEDSDSRDTSAREQQARLDNAQGQVNLTGQSGTTAYNVTGSADGTGVGLRVVRAAARAALAARARDRTSPSLMGVERLAAMPAAVRVETVRAVTAVVAARPPRRPIPTSIFLRTPRPKRVPPWETQRSLRSLTVQMD